MLYVIFIAAFFGFRFFNWSTLSAIRWAAAVATLGFALFVAEPLYRMNVLNEPPGMAIANSRTLPVGTQFIPYMGVANLIFGGPAAGTYCGPCVHYSYNQQKLMNMFGVQSTLMTGYFHSALQFVEDGKIYMTDNGTWYRKITFVGDGNWSPEGPEKYYEIPGTLSKQTPYLFPIGMLIVICLSYATEMSVFANRVPASPFRSKGVIKIMPEMTEHSYRKTGREVMIDGAAGSVLLDVSEVRVLDDAPDIFYHRNVGHFQFVR